MTEIEIIKNTVESAVTVFVSQDKNEKGIVLTKHSLLLLITTIESQKEEIEALQDAFEMLPPKDVEIHERTQIKIKETVQELVIASLKDQVESLKAITELAVKELKEIHIQVPWGLRMHIREVLDEIERLSHEQT